MKISIRKKSSYMNDTIASYSLINKAVIFCLKAHAEQRRKGTDIPYAIHPLNVGMILTKFNCPENLIVAGLLHDCIEDTLVTFDDIKREFNEVIAELVQGCSEKDKSDTWRNRKQHTVEHLKTATDEVCIVACADKQHNLISLIDDYKKHGEVLWKRFNASKQDQLWYYSSLGEVFGQRRNQHPLFKDFQDTVKIFSDLIKD